MHEIFDISFLDEFGDEVSQSQSKAKPSISESEINAQNFRCTPALSYFKNPDASMQVAHNETLPNIKSATSMQESLNEFLSKTSYNKYLKAYEVFKKWQESNKVNSFAEPVLLDYFRELSTKYKPSSLAMFYTMLKTTLLYIHNIDISVYSQLIEFLKEKSGGFQRKKSKVFTAEDVNKFLVEAPDDKYLAIKTVLVFGVIGTRNVDKVTNFMSDFVEDNGNEIIVRIPDAKTKVLKAHAIDGQFAEIVRKYMRLRPIIATTQRFFIQYRNGKCTDKVMGRDKILRMPKEIARFLKLPESETYTGNSFRITTSTTISADTGVAIETLKRHGQQRWNRVAEGYVQESLGYNRQIGSLIAEETNLSSTSSDIIESHENASERIATDTIMSSESSSLGYDEISEDPLLLSQSVATTDTCKSEESSDFNDDTGLNPQHRAKAPKRKRKKRPKRQKEINWYDEECLAQIKLTTDMFKRFSKMAEDDKMKMLSEFSMHRVELFKKYFAAMNTVAVNPINTPTTTAASTNTSAQNGGVVNPAFAIVNVNSLVNTNGINK